jgi:alkanesulfonate monooxygenase SsuD/methylene tetrahydromethanopterin reductase-like flavin-dependent oxidoreductase (luciferase family)
MKFGIQFELQPGRPPWTATREFEVYHESLAQLVLAEELGFDYAWPVEHHFLTGYSSSSAPEVFIAWAAGQTERIRLGHGVIQASKGTNHLVRVAERTAALDIITKGRLDVGFGRGISHEELAAYSVNPDDARPMQVHALETLPKIWVEPTFELDDEFYEFPRRTLHPKPIQTPHPPLWMAANQPDSWKIAGERGIGVLSFGFSAPGKMTEAIALYRSLVANAVTPYGLVNDQVAFSCPTFVADTDEEALETFAPHMLFFLECIYRYLNQWSDTESHDYEFYRKVSSVISMPELTEGEKRGLSSEAQVIRQGVKAGLFCVGSPQTCRETLRPFAAADVDQLIINTQVGSLTDRQIQDSMRRFAAEVMPEFSQPTVDADAST